MLLFVMLFSVVLVIVAFVTLLVIVKLTVSFDYVKLFLFCRPSRESALALDRVKLLRIFLLRLLDQNVFVFALFYHKKEYKSKVREKRKKCFASNVDSLYGKLFSLSKVVRFFLQLSEFDPIPNAIQSENKVIVISFSVPI